MNKNIAVITGASRGIGARLAQDMLAQDYRVICLSREAPSITDPKLVFRSVDLTQSEDVARVASEIAADFEVSHFVHNAGAILPNLVEDAAPKDLATLTQLHLSAPLTLLQAFLPAMKANHFGRVLFNGSRAALGVPTRTAYSATKAGIIGMARTWALELAPHGITVNVVAPGPVRTDNFWDIIPKGSPREAELARRIPVGRLGEVEDIARTFMFLADRDAGFITGQTLYVCGGASVGTIAL